MKNHSLEKKELVKLGRTDASSPAVIGRYVLDPLVLSDACCKSGVCVRPAENGFCFYSNKQGICSEDSQCRISHCRFSWRQYRFANAYRKSLDLNSACEEAGLTRDQAIRFLRRPDVKRWLDDRLQMQETKRSWSAEGRWWAEGDRMYHEKSVPRHQLQIWSEFGERLEVKPSKNAPGEGDQVHINISAEAIRAIQEREKSFDTTAR